MSGFFTRQPGPTVGQHVPHRTGKLAGLTLIVAGLFLAGCQTTGPTVADNAPPRPRTVYAKTLPAGQEAKVGEEAAAVLLGISPLVASSDMQRYVNQVGQWVALQANRPDITWRFGVVEAPDVASFALPGGYVFITRGLLQHLKNEAELAGILAQEIAHVSEGHCVQAYLQRGQGELPEIANATRGILGSGLDRETDTPMVYQADRVGVVLAARAGYDPYGLPRVLQTYAAHATEPAFHLLPGTLPPATLRLAQLGKVMGESLDNLKGGGANPIPGFTADGPGKAAPAAGKAPARAAPAKPATGATVKDKR